MKYQVDEWVIYDPWKDKPGLSNPQRAVILYVYDKLERKKYMYDYEIYVDSAKGRYVQVREGDLYPYEPQN